jgi:hypothetical protein
MEWGVMGHAWIAFASVEKLLGYMAEACLAIEVK